MSNVEARLRRLERFMEQHRRPTRPHKVQDQRHRVIRKNPDNVKLNEIKDDEVIICDDEKSGKTYWMVRLGGSIKKIEMS